MGEWYDVDGNEISMEEWGRLWRLKREARSAGEDGWTLPDKDFTRIGLDVVGDAHVSTVWLGLNHAMFNEGPPLIFETMIFGGEHDQWGTRYSTKEQAKEGHDQVVANLKAGDDPGS